MVSIQEQSGEKRLRKTSFFAFPKKKKKIKEKKKKNQTLLNQLAP
jgi:hypothetical protein